MTKKLGDQAYPLVKDVLKLLGGGAILAAFIVFPGLPLAFASHIKSAERKRYTKDWEKYDQRRLKRTMKRLKKQKVVEIIEKAGVPVVKLTEKGKVRLLRYNLEEMQLKKPESWDRKWRLIVYDVPVKKRSAADAFRYMLNKIGCVKLQKSVYLTPYPCVAEIEYLRSIFDIGDAVVLLTVSGIENEEDYKNHFRL